MHGKKEPDMSWERLYELLDKYKEQGYSPLNALIAVLPVLGKTERCV